MSLENSADNLTILGSTGSIGTQTLKVVKHLNSTGQANFNLSALSCGSNINLLRQQVDEFKPSYVCVKGEQERDELKPVLPSSTELLWGTEGLKRLAGLPEADKVVNALVGFIGLQPTLTALRSNSQVLLANKESLVIGGELVTEQLNRPDDSLIPIDSEHSAIFQSMETGNHSEIRRLLLTASGGPFKDKPLDEISTAGPDQALDHPNWSMGNRITIDSATMVNKAFEVIEAHWLFDVEYDRIEALVHPQSYIHSMVEFQDGSVVGEMGPPDMRIPIQYALTYPHRKQNHFHDVDFTQISELTFQSLDYDRYPAFKTVKQAAKSGGNAPAAINAADEVLIEAFLDEKINFGQISSGLKRISESLDLVKNPDIEVLRETDSWARNKTRSLIQNPPP